MRVRCVVAYDGTDFAGWQRQRRKRSVQGDIEDAILHVTNERSGVVGAGRTDAGVHARGQVAHFDTRWSRSSGELERALNAVLAPDVAVASLGPAPAGFDARRSAVARRYRYTVVSRSVRDPLSRRGALWVARPLDVAAMAEAAGMLLGRHDFGGFGRAMSPDGSTVRTLLAVKVWTGGPAIRFEFEGDAFLRHQVRRMMGLLLDVGRGRFGPQAAAEVLRRGAGAPAARRAPACGLTLWAVRYPPEETPWPPPWDACEGVIGEDIHA